MSFVRRSKFKHVFGKPLKRDQCYDNIRITKNGWDSTFCAVNPKYLAIIAEAAGGGAVCVINIEKVGRLDRDVPLVSGHKATVLDIQWCPHNDSLLATASEDCTVKIWEIPEGGLKKSLTEPLQDLVAHQRRVGFITWHPTAYGVLLSSGADNRLILWNVSSGEKLWSLDLPDMTISMSFNRNGSRLVTTCKDRRARVHDARTGVVLRDGQLHEGVKAQQAVYLHTGYIFSTGFSRTSERQLGLWREDNLEKPLTQQELDTSNGVLFPIYDPDTNLVFLAGKGDSQMRYFEVTEEEPFVHFISTYSSNEPQRGIGWMPKRGLNTAENEVARFYKLFSRGYCEVLSFVVPRKSELFQDDIYPDTISDIPALTADEWRQGKDADPVLMSMKPDGNKAAASRPIPTALKTPLKKADTTPAASASASAARPAPSSSLASSQQRPSAPASGSAKNESLASSARQATTGSPAASSLAPPPAAEATPRVPRIPTTASAGGASEMAMVPSGEYQQLLDDMRKMKVIIKGHEKRIALLESQVKQLERDLYTEGDAPPASAHSGSSEAPDSAATAGNGHREQTSASTRHYVSAHAAPAGQSGSGSGSQTSSKHGSATQSPVVGRSPAPIISAESGNDSIHL